MQKPTVGRIVHYFPGSADSLYVQGKPLAALITSVWSDTCVNLAVFHANGGTPYSKTSVFLQQDGLAAPSEIYAAWPPREGVVLKAELDTAGTALPLAALTDNATQQLIQEANANVAPRVTPDDLKAEITGETYTILPSGRVTVCELTLRSGFTVRGESAVVFAENFDASIGRRVARENAVNQIWQLLGFRLREKYAGSQASPVIPTQEMVERFLAWRLPEDFAPDNFISFMQVNESQWPTGTNLLTSTQAHQMLEHVLGQTERGSP